MNTGRARHIEATPPVQPEGAWRCSWCGRIEGPDDGHGYTDGICIDCLWHYYPDRAARVIAAVNGQTLDQQPRPAH